MVMKPNFLISLGIRIQGSDPCIGYTKIMPRNLTPLITGETYHIYNRGTEKRNIFCDKQDYLRFYASLDRFNIEEPVLSLRDAKRNSDTDIKRLVSISAYCLLPNHFHLMMTQLLDGGISEFLKRVTGGYSGYFNEKNNRSGSLFQGKFKRIHVDSEAYRQYLLVYINENHHVHKLDGVCDIYHTSSVHYQGLKRSNLIQDSHIEKYSTQEAKKLAADIYQRRNAEKKLLQVLGE